MEVTNNLLFDGYCPESLLKGKRAEMRLNEDDFWESEATGLQMTVFPPYAAILRWRGKGKFRASSGVASDSLAGLIMAEAEKEEGHEIFPDKENTLQDDFNLEWYIHTIYESKEKFEAAKFDPNDPELENQKAYLETLGKNDFEKLFQAYDAIPRENFERNLMVNEAFGRLHHEIYATKLIVKFRWPVWHAGTKNLWNKNFDYSQSTLLEISMYITTVFRADRFSDGTIQENFKDGTLPKIFERLRELTSLN